ncbi:MAG TPA: GNAT family N-acetyltransferase [Candidatus Acidoferrales bacterium]|nr:GNAT family N-acetyltransferase [Candidatus Acidoferrales bacterium]
MADAVTIRPARVDELGRFARMRALMAEEARSAWDREYPGWRERYAAYFADKQSAGDGQVFFAVRGDDVVGVAAFSVTDEYRAQALGTPRGWVNSVFVLPELRRQGVARRLMEAGIAWLRARGCVKVRLRTSDEGEPLYRSLGFVAGREMEMDL